MEEEKEKSEDDTMEEDAENSRKGTNQEKVEPKSNGNERRPRKRNRGKKVMKGTANKGANKDEDKAESSKKETAKKVKNMGMIFMCSTKTKQDCYRYKVFGLPANKKDIVQKVYKGMRLFLFDVDLRLMYGIYKAAGLGGFNVEPKAFKSAFPSQVRFTVLEDCLPLSEEKFKKVIKENYYSRNKFDCQLNSEQVKKFCKLFALASKGSKGLKVGRNLVATGRTSPIHDRISRWDQDEERGSPFRREQRLHQRPAIYAREGSPCQLATLPRIQHIPAQTPAQLYAHERNLDIDNYRLEPILERRVLRHVDLEPRRRDEIESHDLDPSYRGRIAPSYCESVHTSWLQPGYYPPALPAEYRRIGRELDYYAAADVATDYRLQTTDVLQLYQQSIIHPRA